MKTTDKSIRDVLKMIEAKQMILPALQREFVWKRRDIETLFDSLLQGFPINTLMFWTVSDIKKEVMEFYEFLDPDYQESVSSNKVFTKVDNDRKTIVVDGQQRLTSLYIAIYGSYQLEKGKNKMELYLNLDQKLHSDDSEEDSISSTDSYYNFKFMTDFENNKKVSQGEHWIKVKDVYESNFDPLQYLINQQLGNNQFTSTTLQRLYSLFRSNEILNAYDIQDESLEHVLNIFVRTNSGGKPLTKGDLLLSVITVNWAGQNKENARQFVQEIVSSAAGYGYKVDKDWVLSCILYILNKEVKLSVNNFDTKTSKDIFDNKEAIRKSINAACCLLNRYGMLERGLTTKLAILPIVYHIYKFGIANNIAKNYNTGAKQSVESGISVQMRTWLFRAIVTNLFEVGTNETLKKIQEIQKVKSRSDYFPITEILADIAKLAVDDNKIDELMETEKKRAFPVLNIIYSSTVNKNYLKQNIGYDIDHIHACTLINKNSGDNRYDTIPNLQLLTFDENRSKNAMSLKDWWEAKSIGEKQDYLLPNQFDTNLSTFDSFYENRKEWFRSILAEKLDAKESSYAGISFSEIILAAVYRKGYKKYNLSWTLHEDRRMQLPLSNGCSISIVPKNLLELTDLSDQQKQALEAQHLVGTWFRETTDKMTNRVVREEEFGIPIDNSGIDQQVEKVFKVFDFLLA